MANLLRSHYLFLLLLFPGFLLSQREPLPLPVWGAFSEEELEMKYYEQDSSANAVVLFDIGQMLITDKNGPPRVDLSVHRSVKILRDAGLDYFGSVSLLAFGTVDGNTIKDLVAQTIRSDGTIIPVLDDHILYTVLEEGVLKIDILFPEATVGSILEIKYTATSYDLISPPRWSFRADVPVKYAYFKFDNETPLLFNSILKGIKGMQHRTSNDGDVFRDSYFWKGMLVIARGNEYYMFDGIALKEEPFLTTLDDYRFTVQHQATGFKWILNTSTSFLDSWEDFNDYLLNTYYLAKNYLDPKEIRPVANACKSIIKEDASKEEQFFGIIKFIQDRVEWTGQAGIMADDKIKLAFKKGKADLPELHYMTIALFRDYGFKAFPVLLSTRTNGSAVKAFPYLPQFNYNIILVELNDAPVLLDLSDNQLKPSLINIEALNHVGYLLDEENPRWINIELPQVDNVYNFNGKLTEDGEYQGQLTMQLKDYTAMDLRHKLEQESFETTWLANLSPGSTLSDTEISNRDNILEPLRVQTSFSTPEVTFTNDEYIYCSPFVYTPFAETPFKAEERSYPVDFPYLLEEKVIIKVEIPDNYELVQLPEDVTIKSQNETAYFQFISSSQDRSVQFLIRLGILKSLIDPVDYPSFRALFETAAQKMQDQIVLKKI